MGGVLHNTIGFTGASCKEKYPGWRGEGHRWSLQLCSLSAGGSCGLLHYCSRTRQWCSWSARSQWFPCRRWWGWVEGDLLFAADGESVDTVVPSWRLTWCWWSRLGTLWCAPPGIECCRIQYWYFNAFSISSRFQSFFSTLPPPWKPQYSNVLIFLGFPRSWESCLN